MGVPGTTRNHQPPPPDEGPQLSGSGGGTGYDLQDIDDFYEAWVDHENDCTITTLGAEINWDRAQFMMEGAANFEYRFDTTRVSITGEDSTGFAYTTSINTSGDEVISRSDAFTLYGDMMNHFENIRASDETLACIQIEPTSSHISVTSITLENLPLNYTSSYPISTGHDWYAPFPYIIKFGKCPVQKNASGLPAQPAPDAQDKMVFGFLGKAIRYAQSSLTPTSPPPNSSLLLYFIDLKPFSQANPNNGLRWSDDQTVNDELWNSDQDADCMSDADMNADVDFAYSFFLNLFSGKEIPTRLKQVTSINLPNGPFQTPREEHKWDLMQYGTPTYQYLTYGTPVVRVSGQDVPNYK